MTDSWDRGDRLGQERALDVGDHLQLAFDELIGGPQLSGQDEVVRLIEAAATPMHRTILVLLYPTRSSCDRRVHSGVSPS